MPIAMFVTSTGSFIARLMPEHAPKAVANFVELATGKREWTDPRDGQRKSEPLYSGTIFHRVIPGKHTIFGKETGGMDVVQTISTVHTGSQDRPATDVVLERVDIEEDRT